MMCSVMKAEGKEEDVRTFVVMAFMLLSSCYTDWGSGWTPACWWEVVNTFLTLLCLSMKVFCLFYFNCPYLDPGAFPIFSSPVLSVLLWVQGERPAGWTSDNIWALTENSCKTRLQICLVFEENTLSSLSLPIQTWFLNVAWGRAASHIKDKVL